MKISKFTATVIAALAIAAVIIIAGCTAPQNTATPTPAPTASPTAAPTATPAATPAATPTATPAPTATPGNQTVEREYQFVERFYSGIEKYNTGITLSREANNTSAAGDYTNASSKMLAAKERMDAAASDFRAMSGYSGSAKETSLSEKWAETAGYMSMSYRNASDAFAEYASQQGRPNQNLVKYNYFVAQANHYSDLAAHSRAQADVIQSTITFMAPAAKP